MSTGRVLLHGAGEVLDALGRREIAEHRGRRAALLADRGDDPLGTLRVPAPDDDLRARARERRRHRGAEPARRAGDDRAPA